MADLDLSALDEFVVAPEPSNVVGSQNGSPVMQLDFAPTSSGMSPEDLRTQYLTEYKDLVTPTGAIKNPDVEAQKVQHIYDYLTTVAQENGLPAPIDARPWTQRNPEISAPASLLTDLGFQGVGQVGGALAAAPVAGSLTAAGGPYLGPLVGYGTLLGGAATGAGLMNSMGGMVKDVAAGGINAVDRWWNPELANIAGQSPGQAWDSEMSTDASVQKDFGSGFKSTVIGAPFAGALAGGISKLAGGEFAGPALKWMGFPDDAINAVSMARSGIGKTLSEFPESIAAKTVADKYGNIENLFSAFAPAPGTITPKLVDSGKQLQKEGFFDRVFTSAGNSPGEKLYSALKDDVGGISYADSQLSPADLLPGEVPLSVLGHQKGRLVQQRDDLVDALLKKGGEGGLRMMDEARNIVGPLADAGNVIKSDILSRFDETEAGRAIEALDKFLGNSKYKTDFEAVNAAKAYFGKHAGYGANASIKEQINAKIYSGLREAEGEFAQQLDPLMGRQLQSVNTDIYNRLLWGPMAMRGISLAEHQASSKQSGEFSLGLSKSALGKIFLPNDDAMGRFERFLAANRLKEGQPVLSDVQFANMFPWYSVFQKGSAGYNGAPSVRLPMGAADDWKATGRAVVGNLLKEVGGLRLGNGTISPNPDLLDTIEALSGASDQQSFVDTLERTRQVWEPILGKQEEPVGTTLGFVPPDQVGGTAKGYSSKILSGQWGGKEALKRMKALTEKNRVLSD
jgi:hypothetical protein